MYKNLKNEITKANLTIAKLAIQLGITEKTLRNKINCITEFNWHEVLQIRDMIAPQMPLEELFLIDSEKI